MSEQTSRSEHMAWCKKRALAYCDVGKDAEAFTSMASDLGKHPETQNHIGLELGVMMLMSGMTPPGGMRHYIEGFN